MVPKRWARRAVTRNLVKRQIYSLAENHFPGDQAWAYVVRLRQGFALSDYMERTGLALTSIQKGLRQAEDQGLIARDWTRVWPTDKGLDFLSDLQALFLP